jgi:hypothetical protein
MMEQREELKMKKKKKKIRKAKDRNELAVIVIDSEKWNRRWSISLALIQIYTGLFLSMVWTPFLPPSPHLTLNE